MIKVFGWTTVVVVAVVLAALSTRALAQRSVAQTLRLDSPNSINDGMYVRLGGVEQWVQIRGENADNPVLLVLHGGPGMSYVPLTPYFREWEKHFTVVQWDRRGVGQTYARNGTADSAAITFNRLADDGIELVEWLRARLRRQRVVLVGHSMGSAVGIAMIMKRPELFHAYVGTDQVIDMARNEAVSYRLLVEQARLQNDRKRIAAIDSLGAPPYGTVDQWLAKQQMISAYDPTAPAFESQLFKTVMAAPGYGMKEMQSFGAGLKFAASALLHEMMTLEVSPRGAKFDVPIFLIEGEHDRINPTSLATEWFATIHAPKKELVVIPGVGHNGMMVRQTEFLNELLRLVRPLAQ